jgi:hypothetical protein
MIVICNRNSESFRWYVEKAFKDDGEVESAIIDGDKKYDSGEEYKLNSDVVITYHTLKKNKPK